MTATTTAPRTRRAPAKQAPAPAATPPAAKRSQQTAQSRRSDGTGRLFSRADTQGRETWYGSWWAHGRRVKRKIGLRRTTACPEGLTKVMAEKELQRRMASDQVLATGSRVNIEQGGDAYVSFLEGRKKRKRTTVQDYRCYLRRHLVPFFKGPMDKIDADRVESYILAKEREGLSPKTINNHLNFLHGLFSFAIKRRWATTNPVARVDKPETPRSEHRRLRFLTLEQIELVIRAVPSDTYGRVEPVLYLAAASTGLRQGELLALRWCDIDWIAGRIRVAESYTRGKFDSPKSGKNRSVPMGDWLAGALERHYKDTWWGQERDHVFAHPETGKTLDPKKIRERFYDALERAGVPRLTFHELRHTYGTQMAAAGTPLSSLQEWMGHADASTTEIYRHYQEDPVGERTLVDKAFGAPAVIIDAHRGVSAPVGRPAALGADPRLEVGA